MSMSHVWKGNRRHGVSEKMGTLDAEGHCGKLAGRAYPGVAHTHQRSMTTEGGGAPVLYDADVEKALRVTATKEGTECMVTFS